MKFGFALFLPIVVGILRAPDLFPPRFWAEDLKVFLAWELQYGITSFITPYAGYLHLIPRLISAVATAMPLEWVNWWFTVAALAVVGWSSAIIFRALGAGWAGLVGSAALVLAPGWTETFGTVTNTQWVLAPALLAIILNSRAIPIVEGLLFAVLSGLTGPFSAAFGIVTLVVFAKSLFDRNWNWVALAAGLTGLIQLTFLITSAEPTGNDSPEPTWLLQRLLALSLNDSLVAVGGGTLLAISCLVGDKKWLRTGLLAGIAMLTLFVSVKFYHEPRLIGFGTGGLRYWYVQGVLWFVIAASLLSETAVRLRVWGAVGLVLLLAGVLKQPLQRPWPWKADDWAAFVEAARRGPATFHYAPAWTFDLDLSKVPR